MEERALRRLLPGPPDPRLKIWGWDEREMHYLAEEMIDFGLDPDAIKTGTAVAHRAPSCTARRAHLRALPCAL